MLLRVTLVIIESLMVMSFWGVCFASDEIDIAVPYQSPEEIDRRIAEEKNRKARSLKGEVKFENNVRRKLTGDRYDADQNKIYYHTDRVRYYDYVDRSGRVIQKRAMSVRETAEVDLNKRDEHGRYLITFPDTLKRGEAYWVSPEQLGLRPKQ